MALSLRASRSKFDFSQNCSQFVCCFENELQRKQNSHLDVYRCLQTYYDTKHDNLSSVRLYHATQACLRLRDCELVFDHEL